VLADFFLPWPHPSPFGAFLSFFYPLVTNTLVLVSFSYLTGTRLKEKTTVVLVILALWVLNWASFGLAVLVCRTEEILLWKMAGDPRVLYELSQISVFGIPGKIVSKIFLPIGSIPGSIVMGYVSSFAFNESKREQLIIYWIALNFAATFIVLEMAERFFCGHPPYRC